jgi:hypothetical protein
MARPKADRIGGKAMETAITQYPKFQLEIALKDAHKNWCAGF